MNDNYNVFSSYKVKKNADFSIQLLTYHPGIPGYDVKYDFVVKFRNEILAPNRYIISSNIDSVMIKDGKIIVPESVRQAAEEVKVTAVFNDSVFNGASDYKSELTIKLKAWEKTFEDDFNTFDVDLWSLYRMTVPKDGDIIAACFENSYVKQGNLCLDVLRKDYKLPGVNTTFKYSRGYVSTKGKFSQVYGCFKAKMKLAKSSFTNGGVMSSFWLMPEGKYKFDYFFKRTDTDEFWGCSEVDILEGYKMTNGGSQHTEHWWAEDGSYMGQTPKFYKNSSYDVDSWHEFAFVWTEYGVYYYVDGELAVYNDNIEPVDNPSPAHIIFGTAVSPKGYAGWTGELEGDEELPQTTYIDWLKVYK